ncbi:MAG: hypothetical protein J6D03_10330 [Clostridia bacterium]|nr:hypothetical protein [Clostridia bacterium]
MVKEGQYNLNNAHDVIERLKKKGFPETICATHLNESGTGEVTISEESITKNAKDIINLWDEN